MDPPLGSAGGASWLGDGSGNGDGDAGSGGGDLGVDALTGAGSMSQEAAVQPQYGLGAYPAATATATTAAAATFHTAAYGAHVPQYPSSTAPTAVAAYPAYGTTNSTSATAPAGGGGASAIVTSQPVATTPFAAQHGQGRQPTDDELLAELEALDAAAAAAGGSVTNTSRGPRTGQGRGTGASQESRCHMQCRVHLLLTAAKRRLLNRRCNHCQRRRRGSAHIDCIFNCSAHLQQQQQQQQQPG